MSKFFTQQSNVAHAPEIPDLNRRQLFKFAGAVALVMFLAYAVTGLWAAANGTARINQSAAVPYSNALEMQYAQPWLSGAVREAAVNVPYSNPLEMQYAQPWLNVQEAAVNVPYSNALEMQYAQPWLNVQKAAESCPAGLDFFYACQNGNIK